MGFTPSGAHRRTNSYIEAGSPPGGLAAKAAMAPATAATALSLSDNATAAAPGTLQFNPIRPQ